MDLAQVGAVSVALSDWHADFRRTGEGSVATPAQLMDRVRALPPVSGRVGAAIRTIEAGGLNDFDATNAAFRDIDEIATRFRRTLTAHTTNTRRPSPHCEPSVRPGRQQRLFEPDPTDESSR